MKKRAVVLVSLAIWMATGTQAQAQGASGQAPVSERPVFADVPATAPQARSSFAAACSTLRSFALPNGKVLSAQPMEALKGKAFFASASGRPLPPTAAATLPSFCRIMARVSPVAGSTINVEIWLPAKPVWNTRYLGTGNGGPGGAISYGAMVSGLLRGFAVANNDLGTAPVSTLSTIYPATARPQSGVDLGHRADHQMVVVARALIRAFYGRDPRSSIFAGCSTGGQEALALAQRYPTDYDGILAGAPANNRTHLHAYFLWNFMAQQAAKGGLTAEKFALIQRYTLADCAGKDGGLPTDGFLTDPRQCKFSPVVLPRCADGKDDGTCLTQPELVALQRLYAGPTNPRTGERIFAGVPFGTDWSGVIAHGGEGWQNIDSYTWNWTFHPGYDYRRFDFDHDLDQVDANSASYLNSNSADLSTFSQHGGKLILYTGTADPHIPYPDTMNYYERLIAANSGDLDKTQKFARYYLAPGMGHCGGGGVDGTGFGDFGQANRVPTAIENDILMQLVRWVEAGIVPAPVARRRDPDSDAVTAERPLCAYPQFPEFTAGDARQASSFRCKPHARGNVPLPAPRYLNSP